VLVLWTPPDHYQMIHGNFNESLRFVAIAIVLFLVVYLLPDTIRNRIHSAIVKIRPPFKNRRANLTLFALGLVALYSFGCFYVFQGVPHVVDGGAQLFHAKIFALGKLTVPCPPQIEFFIDTHLIADCKSNGTGWYSQYPPGFTLLLTLGHFIRAPWIINPLLSALTAIVLYFLGTELFDRRVGTLAAFCHLVSTFVFILSSEFMNHVCALFCFNLYALCLLRAWRKSNVRYAFAAGTAWSYLFATRPFTALALAGPPTLLAAFYVRKSLLRQWRLLLAMALSAAIGVSLMGLFNYLTNGSPFLFGYEKLWGSGVLPGFGKAAWGQNHTLYRGLYYIWSDVITVNDYLFDWPIPSYTFCLILLCTGLRDPRHQTLFLAFASLALGYTTYFFWGVQFGPRFLYESVGCLFLLTACGMVRAYEYLKALDPSPRWQKSLLQISLLLLVLMVASNILQKYPLRHRVFSRNMYNVWGANLAAIKSAIKKHNTPLLFIVEAWQYKGIFWYMSPDLKGKFIIAKDLGPKRNAEVIREFPYYSPICISHGNIRPCSKTQGIYSYREDVPEQPTVGRVGNLEKLANARHVN